MTVKTTQKSNTPFELKGSLHTLTTLKLNSLDLTAVQKHISELQKKAPSFFKQTPIIIDLKTLQFNEKNTQSQIKPLKDICNLLRDHQMIPIGLQRNTQSDEKLAALLGISQINKGSTLDLLKQPENRQQSTSTSIQTNNKMISTPVRSGQQIYAKQGDLILLGMSSAGSELIADHNIHIYGTLRGKAIAGLQGDTTARIFCQNLQAELISIAGVYSLQEDFPPEAIGTRVSIALKDDALIFEPL